MTEPITALWRAVIVQAIRDADFRAVCDLAGLEPEDVAARMLTSFDQAVEFAKQLRYCRSSIERPRQL
jgi:hypothetical protein